MALDEDRNDPGLLHQLLHPFFFTPILQKEVQTMCSASLHIQVGGGLKYMTTRSSHNRSIVRADLNNIVNSDLFWKRTDLTCDILVVLMVAGGVDCAEKKVSIWSTLNNVQYRSILNIVPSITANYEAIFSNGIAQLLLHLLLHINHFGSQ